MQLVSYPGPAHAQHTCVHTRCTLQLDLSTVVFCLCVSSSSIYNIWLGKHKHTHACLAAETLIVPPRYAWKLIQVTCVYKPS